MSINYLYEVLELSRITIIGYNYTNEHIKDKIISKLPYLKVNNFDINKQNFKSLIRDLKLKCIIENYKIPRYILIDFDEFSLSKKEFEDFKKIFHSFIGQLLNEITNLDIRIIILCYEYSGISTNLSCGVKVQYISDVIINIKEKYIVLSKNRYGHGNGTIIEFDGLEKYNYICNYENIE